eukprot:m.13360 g.13360  ORF g.13360 m.13360 type:complete len:168 (+) comp4650_c0_seq1:939-1442(+)
MRKVCGREHCPGQTDAEYRTQFAAYVIAASPLIIGTDIRNMTTIMKSILLNKELLAVNQDYLAPAGDLVTRYSANGTDVGVTLPTIGDSSGLLWARHLSNGAIATGVTNLQDDTPLQTSIPFSVFGVDGWGPTTKAAIRDLWALKDAGTAVGSINVTAIVWTLSKTS